MEFLQQHIQFSKGTFSYYVKGNGTEKVLLMFYGFGLSKEDLLPIAHQLNYDSIYIFDLPFHGESKLNHRHDFFLLEDWNVILTTLLEKDKIDTFDVFGFSLGARFALLTLEKFSTQLKNVFLAAPDGVKTSFWYNFATYPSWSRKLFKRTIVKPNFYFSLVKTFANLKLVDKGIVKFANTQMKTRRLRYQVCFTWISLSKFFPNIKRLIPIINQEKIQVTIILGEYDKIVSKHQVEKMMKGIHQIHFVTLKSGHTGLLNRMGKTSLEFFNFN